LIVVALSVVSWETIETGLVAWEIWFFESISAWIAAGMGGTGGTGGN
jgi:hypothetical protein